MRSEDKVFSRGGPSVGGAVCVSPTHCLRTTEKSTPTLASITAARHSGSDNSPNNRDSASNSSRPAPSDQLDACSNARSAAAVKMNRILPSVANRQHPGNMAGEFAGNFILLTLWSETNVFSRQRFVSLLAVSSIVALIRPVLEVTILWRSSGGRRRLELFGPSMRSA